MKAYIKSYRKIKEDGRMDGDYFIYPKGYSEGPVFVPDMKEFCGKGPFDFEPTMFFENEGWYKGINWNWHISWLNPVLKNEQYLLEF